MQESGHVGSKVSWRCARRRAASRHHVQIIASAGSGKTEVVSQRIAELLAEGVPPTGVVAFTFTERAAEELKNRISHRVAQRLGKDALDLLSGLYVGTITRTAIACCNRTCRITRPTTCWTTTSSRRSSHVRPTG